MSTEAPRNSEVGCASLAMDVLGSLFIVLVPIPLGWLAGPGSILLQGDENQNRSFPVGQRFERLAYDCPEHPATVCALHRVAR
jgi:hypothetical protein